MCDSVFSIDDKTKIMSELKVVDVGLRNIEHKIDKESEERKEKDIEITSNYITRFDGMKDQIDSLKKDMKEYGKDIGKKFMTIITILVTFLLGILGVTMFIILSKIWGWI